MYRMMNLGQASPAPSGGASAPSPASPGGGFRGGSEGRGLSDLRFEGLQSFNWPAWPAILPPAAAPSVPPGTTCAWEKDVQGNDVYVCRPAAGAPVVTAPPLPTVYYGPVGIPAQTVFRFF